MSLGVSREWRESLLSLSSYQITKAEKGRRAEGVAGGVGDM